MFHAPEMTSSLVETVSTRVALSTVTIRTSCISLSSLFSGSSVSDFLTSVFKYFPEHHSVDSDIYVQKILTDGALLNLYHRNP